MCNTTRLDLNQQLKIQNDLEQGLFTIKLSGILNFQITPRNGSKWRHYFHRICKKFQKSNSWLS